jgi:hypothetical protein
MSFTKSDQHKLTIRSVSMILWPKRLWTSVVEFDVGLLDTVTVHTIIRISTF